MKLLLTMNVPYLRAYGGANRSNRRIAEALAARGHGVWVVAPALRPREGGGVVSVDAGGVKLLAVEDSGRIARCLAETIEAFAPDVVLVSSEDPSQRLLAIARDSGRRVVYLAHTPQLFPFGPAALYPGEARTRLVREVDAVLAISRFVGEYVRRWADLTPEVIHPPHFDPPRREEVRSPRGRVLLMNACAVKGMAIFLALADALPQVRFAALPGYGTTSEDRRALAARPNVELRENHEDLDQVFHDVSVLLMPTLWIEGFGMAAIDAMSRGVPVIASRLGGLPEALLGGDLLLPVHEITSFQSRLDESLLPAAVVPPQDVEPWRRALAALLADQGVYTSRSAAAAERARTFVAGLSIEPLETWLARVAAGGRRVSSAGAQPPVGAASRPPPDLVAQRLAALSREQRALLVRRLKERSSAAEVIPSVERGGEMPLSPAQKRIWFLEQLEPEAALYNIPLAFSIRGPLEPRLLERSLAALVQRHESLRTTFGAQEGRPFQRVAAEACFALPRVELGALGAAAAAETARVLAVEATRPFDLATGPPLRALLLSTGQDRHVLSLTVHHLVADGWSMSVLLDELALTYSALARGEPPPLRALPVQYVDFAAWQARALAGPAARAHLDYWRGELAGLTPLELPYDHPRAAVRTFRGGAAGFTAPPSLVRALEELARAEGTTLFVVLLALVEMFLARHTGAEDVAVGVPVANRRRAELEGVVGCFVNTLVLRARVRPEQSFRQLVGAMRDKMNAAHEHQDLPFEQLVEELSPARSLTRAPLFQALFVLQNAPPPRGELPAGLEITPEPIECGSAKLDLSIGLAETSQGLRGALEYNADLFTAASVERMVARLALWAQAAAEGPDRSIRELCALPSDERRLLLEAAEAQPTDLYPRPGQAAPPWPAPASPDSGARLLHELFEAQARRTPDALAVVAGAASLRYRDLSERSERLAADLLARGVGLEGIVGVAMERSLELLPVLLAILKTGAAYLPLDLRLPGSRLRFLLEDAGVDLIATDAASRARLPDTPVEQWISAEAASVGAPSLPRHGHPRARAYILYTSGSTGAPKGVAIEHASAVALLSWAQTIYRTEQLGGVLASTALGFDLSVFELFLPLSTGGTVVLAPDLLTALDGPCAHPLSLVNTLPTVLAEALRLRPLPASVRVVNLAGEPLDEALLDRLLALPHVEQVYDLYGPTECTTYSTYARGTRGSAPTIGRPIAGTRAYVLDRHLELAPLGVTGELYLGGRGLARGYLARPALTSERFLPDPHAGDLGARMYATGDRARYLADGTLQLHGRADRQVKVRGHRVELDEVEAVLRRHPAVAEVVVVADGARLIAFLSARPPAEAPGLEAGLRAFAEAELPPWMVPSSFRPVAAWPRTPSGKLDRRALLELPVTHPPSAEAPATPAARAVRDIFAAVLARVPDTISPTASFFDLGGHSLLAVQAIARLRESFAAPIPLRAIFEHPSAATLAHAIEHGLLDLAPGTAPPQITPGATTPGAGAPLSFAQKRLWVLDHLDPGNPAYNVAAAVRAAGTLDLPALRAAFLDVLARHQILRARIELTAEGPVQVFAPVLPDAYAELDLSALPPGEREREVDRLTSQEALLPFDLSRGPLIRARVVRVAPDDHLLVATMHHVVSDAWSTGVLLRELSLAYAARRARRAPTLPPLPVQYADYARWQHERLARGDLAREVDFWKARLEESEPLDLRGDRPYPALRTHRGAAVPFTLEAQVYAALRRLAAREGATLFMTLLASFKVLLHHYTGQRALSVGVPIGGRGRPELEGVIGFFVNTVVMRTSLAGRPTFIELLARVKETALAAYAHQEVPFEKVIEELSPERNLSRAPLFQVMFTLIEVDAGLALPEASWREVGVPAQTAKFDLSLAMVAGTAGLSGSMEYSTDLYEEPTIQRLLLHASRLLEQIARDPGRRIDEYSLLSAEEAELAERQASGPAVPAGEPRTLLEAFARRAAAAPDHPAVASPAGRLTYGELAHLSDRIAAALHDRGAKDEARIGVVEARTPRLIAAILGVMKAGGVYLPLDPRSPERWRRELIERSGLRLVIDGSEPWLEESRPRPLPELDPRRLAYSIYTSGTTASPKGVLLEHGGLGGVAFEQQRRFELGPGDRVLQLASWSFDASLWELTMALSSGATLVLPGPDLLDTPESFLELLEEEAITALTAPPSLLLALPRELPSTVRTLIVAGERCPASVVARHAPGRRFFNAYGPTEGTICATIERVEAEEPQGPNIGRPIAGAVAHVLDANLAPSPCGVPGELYLGGGGVARGYEREPARTAERFVPDPFARTPGARLYRTGDRACRRADGRIDYLGRADRQVKIRGHRVELEAVESALLDDAAVKEAAVVERGGALVAYLVWRDAASASWTDLRARLEHELAASMVPGRAVALERLPRLASGKVDGRALPPPDDGRGRGGEPRGAAEQAIAAVWREVLGLGRVGREESFFELGGHSLTAMQVVSRLRARLGHEVPLRSVFEAPTVAALARRLSPGPVGPSIRRAPDRARAPLSFAQKRLWFIDSFEPGNPAYNVPAAIRAAGPLDLAALRAALWQVIARHEVLRARFELEEEEPVQTFPERLPEIYAEIDLTELPAAAREHEAQRLTAEEAVARFDLSRGPLVRARAVRLAPQDHLLLATMHHIVSDGWSTSILVAELSELYAARVEGRPASVAPLPVQYADYALWQRQRLQRGELARPIAFWKAQLAQSRPLELAGARPRPAIRGHRGAAATFVVDPAVHAALRALALREGATVFMTLLAAFKVLLWRYSGEVDLSVGVPIGGRSHLELEGLIGFFVNTVVMRTNAGGDPTFVELLARVKETALEAYAHQEVPFECVVEELAPARNLARTPLFQVMFSLLEARGALALTGARWSDAGAPAQTAKFDLALSMTEGADGLSGVLEYSTELFDRSTILGMLEQASRLLAQIARAPERRIGSYDLALAASPPPPPPLPPSRPAERAHAEPQDEIERAIAAVWREVLGVGRISRDDNFFELGGDSILALRAISAARRRGLALTTRQIFQHPTLSALARAVRPAAEPAPAVERQGQEALPLTPIQRWFFALELADPHHFNQAVALPVGREVTPEQLRAALQRLQDAHPALRVHFVEQAGQRVQRIAPAAPLPFTQVDLAGAEAELPQVLAALQASLDLLAGPLWRAALIERGDRPALLLLVAHHLIVDAYSWQVLLEDLRHPPAASDAYARWVLQQPARDLPLSRGGRGWSIATAETAELTLGQEDTATLLLAAARVHHTAVDRLLLAAVFAALSEWTGGSRVAIAVERHGRDDTLDGARLVAWCTALHPLELEVTPTQSLSERVRRIDAELAGDPPSALAPDTAFNYLGRAGDGDGPELAVGPTRSPRQHRLHALEITASIRGGRLAIGLTFSPERHPPPQAQAFLERTAALLRVLIERARAVVSLEGVAAILPLAPLQHGLLFHALERTAPVSYFQQVCVTLRGELDVAALERAWQSVVARHESLRASFLWELPDEPLRLIHARAELPLRSEDWRALLPAEVEARLARVLAEDRAQGFELSRAPLMRLLLLRVGDAEHRLLWTHHHLLLDGWSLPLLYQEVAAAYDGRPIAGTCPALEPAATTSKGAEQYFRSVLGAVDAPTPLSLRPRRGAASAEDYRVVTRTLPAATTAALEAERRARAITLPSAICAAWALVLAAEADADDVVFGATVAGRPEALEGAETALGLFINTLPLRVRLPAGRSIAGYLGAVQQGLTELREHEQTPLAAILWWSGVPRGTPLFESVLVVENYPRGVLAQGAAQAGSSLAATQVQAFERTSFPVSVGIVPGEQLFLRLTYDARRLDERDARRMLRGLELALNVLLRTDPASPLDACALQDPSDVARLAAFNATAQPFAEPADLLALFRRAVAEAPGAPAVISGEATLTYAQLDQESSSLAATLDRRRVAVLAYPASSHLVIGVLAALKAGVPFAPLDPELPPRRREMLRAELAAYRPAQGDAYVIFTSGTTGRPKAVLVPLTALANRLLWSQRVFRLDARDRVILTAAVGFDFAVWEVLAPLIAGAALVAPPRAAARDPLELAELIEQHRVTIVHFIPSMLDLFLERADPRKLGSLRIVYSGGEPLPAGTRARFARTLSAALYNQYGPTEATIDVTAFRCEGAGDDQPVPIGAPIDNTRVHVLDRRQRAVPIGAVGELYLAGANLARGYLGDPRLTAERFLPDPMASTPGARMFKSGDLGRWREDGTLELVGRRDRQVKVRGVRVELEEIEAALAALPAVREAAVVLEGGRLAAFVSGPVEASALRAQLGETLPEALLPAELTVVEELPRSPAGKLERGRLTSRASRAGVKPTRGHTPVLEILGGIWSDVLGVDCPAADARFFELGGDSLSAIRLLTRAARAFDVELRLAGFLEAPTIAGMARAIAHAQSPAAAHEGRLRRREVQAPGAAPLTLAQAHLRLLDLALPGHASFNVPASIRLPGALDAAALRGALRALGARHEVLAACFPFEDGEPVQRSLRPPPLTVVDLCPLPAPLRAAEAESLAAFEARRPFDLALEPPLRAVLLTLAGDDHVLLLTAHHLAVDGWSMQLITRELRALYLGGALPPPALQLSDYAAWQHEQLEGAWDEPLHTLLDAFEPPLPLLSFAELSSPAAPTFSTAFAAARVEPALAARLRAYGRALDATPFMVLLAGFEALLHLTGGATDLRVATIVSGRDRPELQDVVGLLMNTLLLRTDLGGDPRFDELARRVRRSVLEGHARADLPFELVVELLEKEHGLPRAALTPVLFVMQDFAPSSLPGFTGERTAALTSFELIVAIVETQGGYDVVIQYKADLFRRETIEAWLRAYPRLLSSVLARPDLRLSQLEAELTGA